MAISSPERVQHDDHDNEPQFENSRALTLYNADCWLLTRDHCGTSMPLKVGDPAPDFELPAAIGEKTVTVRLQDYRGKQNVVVTFHPLDWTPT